MPSKVLKVVRLSDGRDSEHKLPAVIREIDELAGDSDLIREVRHMVILAARWKLTVWINGGVGTGKGKIARAIHDLSASSKGPFIQAWCGTADAFDLLGPLYF